MKKMNSKSETQNCWEFMKCPEEIRQKCQVYGKSLGREGWLVTKDATTRCFACKKYDSCMDCPWYKKLNPI